MIKFSLKCDNDHTFDSWFGSNDDFEKLSKRKLVTCSICDSTSVQKAVMAPRVNSEHRPPLSHPKTPAEQAVTEFRKHIEASADNVGHEFANEARKIHDGEAPERAIFGETKPEEARALIEDGVQVTRLPWSSRRTN